MKTLTLHIILFAALALLFAGCDLSPDADTVSVTGKIVTNGSGVSGITITLSGTEGVITTVTDENGNFTFTGAWPGHYTITCSKTGYTFPDGAVSLTVSDTSCTVPSIEAVSIWSSVQGTEEHEYANGIVRGEECYYIVGSQANLDRGDFDITVKKIGLGGSLLWEKFYGSEIYDDFGHAIVLTSDSSLVVAGRSGDFDNAKLIKIDLDGNEIWSKSFGGDGLDNFYSAVVASDGSIIAVGSTYSSGPSTGSYAGAYSFSGDGIFYNGWIVRVGSDGSFLGHKVLGGNDYNDEFKGITALSDGRFGIVGYTGTYQEEVDDNVSDIWFVVVDSELTDIQSHSYNYGREDQGESLASDSEGAIYLTGSSQMPLTIDGSPSFQFDQLVIKVDSGGTLQWAKNFDGGLYLLDMAFSCSVTSSDTLLITGNTVEVKGNTDLSVRHIASDGSLLWSVSAGGFSTEEGSYILSDRDSGFVVVGYTETYGSGGEDIWIIKGDSNGNIETE